MHTPIKYMHKKAYYSALWVAFYVVAGYLLDEVCRFGTVSFSEDASSCSSFSSDLKFAYSVHIQVIIKRLMVSANVHTVSLLTINPSFLFGADY